MARLSGLQRREQILACARYVFAQSGYEGARTAEIAARAEVSERLLYKHFDTKAALFVAVTRDTSRRVAAGYRELAKDAVDVESAINELYFGRLGPGQFRGRTQGLFFARSHGPFDDPELDEALGEAYRALASAATHFFTTMAKRGLMTSSFDPEVRAWQWSGVLRQHDVIYAAYPVRRASAIERRVVADFIETLGPATTS